MEPSQVTIVSFIVKVYVERQRDDGRKPTWHGQVTHVPGGQARYVRDLDGIGLYIGDHLARLGVTPSWYWRARQWLRRHMPG